MKNSPKPIVLKLDSMPKIVPKKRIKVLWYSDFLRHTGFGNVAEEIVSRLHKTGKYEFVVLGINYNGVPYCKPNSEYYHLRDIPVYPAITNGPNSSLFGYDILEDMLLTQKFDVFFVLQDSFNLLPMKDIILKAKKKQNFSYIFYFPVDGDLKRSWIEDAIELADTPVVYTNYGKKKVEEYNSYLNLKVLPHGIDLEKFKPFETKEERFKFRRNYMGISDDEFLITNVNRNQPRKDLPRTIIAFREFCKKNKKIKAKLYLHCNCNDGAGHRIHEFVQNYLPRALWKRVMTPPEETIRGNGVPIETLCNIYAASDIITSTTYGEGMFVEGTKVKTISGWKNIEDITKHDYVYTHLGKFQRVGKTLKKPLKNGYAISLWKFNLPMICSEDHPILTERGFVRADKLKKDDIVKYRINKENKDVKYFNIDISNLKNRYWKVTKNYIISKMSRNNLKTKKKLYLTKEALKFFAYYVSDGSILYTKNKVFGVSLCFHIKKFKNRVLDISNFINQFCPDYKVSIFKGKREKDKNCFIVSISNKILGEMCLKLFGERSKNKFINEDIVTLKKDKLEIFFKALISGDGDIGKNKSKKQIYIRYKTVSLDIVNALKDIVLQLGFIPSITEEDNSGGYGSGTIFTLKISTGKNGNKGSFLPKGNIKKDFVRLPIRKISKITLGNNVYGYDLQVPGDNSYTITQATVHNCGLSTLEGMACKTPVVIPDNSASTEIIGKNNERGYLVKCGETISDYDVHKFDNELMRPLTNIDDLVRIWEQVYRNPKEAQKKAEKAYKWLQNYTWDKITKQWEKIIDNAYLKNDKYI